MTLDKPISRWKKIEKPQEVVLLGVTIDDKQNYKTNIENIFRTAKYKLNALQRIRKYSNTDKTKPLYNAFRSSQVYYVPLTWMSTGKLLF